MDSFTVDFEPFESRQNDMIFAVYGHQNTNPDTYIKNALNISEERWQSLRQGNRFGCIMPMRLKPTASDSVPRQKDRMVVVYIKEFINKIGAETRRLELLSWIMEAYGDEVQMKLSAFVYLMSVKDAQLEERNPNPMYSGALLAHLHELCGHANCDEKVTLVTTSWEEASPKDHESIKVDIGNLWKRLNTGIPDPDAQPLQVRHMFRDRGINERTILYNIIENTTHRVLQKQRKLSVLPNDVLIAVMGGTGAGKTNFIDKVNEHLCPDSAQSFILSNNQLDSDTKSVTAYRVYNHPTMGNRIVLVDTPGFDPTHETDADILREIGGWLKKTYQKDVKLAGVLYAVRIADNRMTGSARQSLAMFGKLCGANAAKRVVIVTTCWDTMSAQKNGKQREQELRENYFKPLLDLGASMERFDNKPKTTGDILARILKVEKERQVLFMQDELVHTKKMIEETAAAIELKRRLTEEVSGLQQKLQAMREQTESISGNDSLSVEELDKAQAGIDALKKELMSLKVPLVNRILRGPRNALRSALSFSSNKPLSLGNPAKTSQRDG